MTHTLKSSDVKGLSADSPTNPPTYNPNKLFRRTKVCAAALAAN